MLRQKNQQSVYDQIGVRSAQPLMDLHKLRVCILNSSEIR